MSAIRSYIDGAFTGFHSAAVFKLGNGQVWQQSRYAYEYCYLYRPEVRIETDGSTDLLYVAGMNDPIEVRQARILAHGQIVSDFKGFRDRERFKFSNGSEWEQSEYKYHYHYAYRPRAMVLDGVAGVVLMLDGVSATVKVRRVR